MKSLVTNPLWMVPYFKVLPKMVNIVFTLRSVLWPQGRTMVTRWGLSPLSSAWRVWKRGRWGGGGKWGLWTCPTGWEWMGRDWGAPPPRFSKGAGGAEAGGEEDRDGRTKTESKSWIMESVLISNTTPVFSFCVSVRENKSGWSDLSVFHHMERKGHLRFFKHLAPPAELFRLP